ncbi:hypothetical protein BH10PSE12_BH10PSE12_32150 [soil metagenome]
MFAMIGATVFFGAASFALFVTLHMVKGYWPLIVTAMNGEPMPLTLAGAPRVAYRPRSVTPAFASIAKTSFIPRRLAPQPRVSERAVA